MKLNLPSSVPLRPGAGEWAFRVRAAEPEVRAQDARDKVAEQRVNCHLVNSARLGEDVVHVDGQRLRPLFRRGLPRVASEQLLDTGADARQPVALQESAHHGEALRVELLDHPKDALGLMNGRPRRRGGGRRLKCRAALRVVALPLP